jgi:hypothetical protein
MTDAGHFFLSWRVRDTDDQRRGRRRRGAAPAASLATGRAHRPTTRQDDRMKKLVGCGVPRHFNSRPGRLEQLSCRVVALIRAQCAVRHLAGPASEVHRKLHLFNFVVSKFADVLCMLGPSQHIITNSRGKKIQGQSQALFCIYRFLHEIYIYK